MRTVDAVLFDKTGTLTKGEPTVTARRTGRRRSTTRTRCSRLAAAAEADSEHPLARAIVGRGRGRGITVPASTGLRVLAGRRASPRRSTAHGPRRRPAPARGAGLRRAAPRRRVARRGRDRPARRRRRRRSSARSQLADEIRPESRQAVDALHRPGIAGRDDHRRRRGRRRRRWPPSSASTGCSPACGPRTRRAKVARAAGARAARSRWSATASTTRPALAQADVGIAIGAGTDVAIASAGVILASDDPRSVLSVIELSKASYRKMKQNLWWAAGYNLISVPLAAGVLAPIGFVLPMSVGRAADVAVDGRRRAQRAAAAPAGPAAGDECAGGARRIGSGARAS